MSRPAPARRTSDVFHAIGWTAATLWSIWEGVSILVVAEPSRQWHAWITLAIWGLVSLPMAISAIGLWRLLYRTRERRKEADRNRRARPWTQQHPPLS